MVRRICQQRHILVNIEIYCKALDSFDNMIGLLFRKARINVEKGQCYEAIVDKYVTELSFENVLLLTISMSSPENMDILMIDKNQFNGMKYSENSFTGDKFLYEIGDKDWILYDIELYATKLNPRDPGADSYLS